jgi:hypothetical protein
VGVTIKVGHLRFWLMPQPRDVNCYGVESGALQQAEPMRPLINGGAEVMKLPCLNELRLIV